MPRVTTLMFLQCVAAGKALPAVTEALVLVMGAAGVLEVSALPVTDLSRLYVLGTKDQRKSRKRSALLSADEEPRHTHEGVPGSHQAPQQARRHQPRFREASV